MTGTTQNSLLPIQRVLSDDGDILAPPAYLVSLEEAKKILETMWISRLVDDRMITLQRQGMISFAMSSLGEEACSAASTAALSVHDWVYPQYRENGAIFYRGYPIQTYVHHMFCNGKDPLLGRQMPNHFGSRELNVVTVSSPIGTKIPHAVGAAYAMKLRGEQNVSLVYFGEGASSEGDFHAGLNFASVLNTPTLFFCRNNQYAISTGTSSQFASDGIAPKGIGYGMEAVRVDGNDPLAVFDVTKKAKIRALNGDGPTLIEALTYRMGAHSTSDDPTRYRDNGEVESWKKRCPILLLTKYLEKNGIWSPPQTEALKQQIQDEISKAIQLAKMTPPPPSRSLIEDVYASVPAPLIERFEKNV